MRESRLPGPVSAIVRMLAEGSFLDRRENVLAFGNPSSGKTHLLYGIGQELVRSVCILWHASTSPPTPLAAIPLYRCRHVFHGMEAITVTPVSPPAATASRV